MDYHLVEAKHIARYRLHLRFADGSHGEVDLEPELTGPIFEPLHDVDYFAGFTVDPTFHTLVWPNGADFAPEFLREQLRVKA